MLRLIKVKASDLFAPNKGDLAALLDIMAKINI